MKKLPLSRQTFSKLIEQDLLYIDKTKWVWKLVQEENFYFLSRPRRFGKSLLLSTFRSFFEGREDLFKDLYIYDKVTEWKQYPIIYIDYSSISYRDGLEIFHISLLSYLQSIARDYDLEIKEKVPADFLREMIKQLNKKHGSVAVSYTHLTLPTILRV